ncbi:hypothetical protein [Chitinophaga barathri]|uniref:Uncharacterized protein n=1 Tax=Chitinophaga barathri TaxID=1647451 RepID=A0A3N4MDW1_9BACT|nr:hypothetical protein [Chitinophaga barathri]RPD38290.1 hypothetical protein EG028_25705 [Chitinophaga barathri]
MKKQSLAALFIAGTLLFAACKKNDSPEPANPVQDTRDLLEKLGPQTQSFTFNVSELPKTISLKGGVKVTFPAGSLTKGGVAVTGNVTVEAVELLKRSDIVLFGANTNHISGAPLQSDGSFLIDVKANGEKVDQQLKVPIRVEVPAKRDGGTQLWVGVDSVQGNQFAWQQPRQPNGGQVDVKMENNKFTFDFGQLGWVNCDIFWSWANPKTTVKVSVPNNPGSMASFRAFSGETFVFFIAKNANVVAQLYTPDGANRVKSYDNMMPVGAEGRLIAFSIKDGKYYFMKKDITISANMDEAMTLSETTESAIQAEISALDGF